jgi:2-polyprenyl-3-methyl-5-hydroxy-6-metoxy-1,4-benzoquinol methylase
MQAPTTATFFDQYASDFAAIYGNGHSRIDRLLNWTFRRSMKLRHERTLAGCLPILGRTVLDIGCGPGHYSVDLAKRGAASVVGIDFADGMLQLAEARAAQAGVQRRCSFIRGDFLEATFEQPFDYTIAMGLMDYVAEPRTFLARVLSVTKSRAFFSFPVAGGLLAWQRKIRYQRRCPLVTVQGVIGPNHESH